MHTILLKAHQQVLEARNVEYLVQSIEFRETWGFSSLEERNLLTGLLTVAKIKRWMAAVRKSHLYIMKSNELKALARAVKIPNYSRLTREELQINIWEYYERRK